MRSDRLTGLTSKLSYAAHQHGGVDYGPGGRVAIGTHHSTDCCKTDYKFYTCMYYQNHPYLHLELDAHG